MYIFFCCKILNIQEPKHLHISDVNEHKNYSIFLEASIFFFVIKN